MARSLLQLWKLQLARIFQEDLRRGVESFPVADLSGCIDLHGHVGYVARNFGSNYLVPVAAFCDS